MLRRTHAEIAPAPDWHGAIFGFTRLLSQSDHLSGHLWPSLGHMWAMSAAPGPMSAEFCRNDRDLGQILPNTHLATNFPNAAEFSPISGKLGPSSSRFRRTRHIFGRTRSRFGRHGSKFGRKSNFDRGCHNFDDFGANSAELGPISVQLGPNLADIWPGSAGLDPSGPTSAKFGLSVASKRPVADRILARGAAICIARRDGGGSGTPGPLWGSDL